MWRSWRWWLCSWCLCCVLPVLVPWPPRSMAESWKRQLRWEKWSSKTLQGAVRPTDHLAGRDDAHGPVFPTRGPCRFRARHYLERPPPGSDFYALPLPWGALQWRAYACPAWRVMFIAPAGSSSNSVHKKNQDKPLTLSSRRNWGQGKGVGGLSPSYQTLFLCLSFSHSLTTYLSLSSPNVFFCFF